MIPRSETAFELHRSEARTRRGSPTWMFLAPKLTPLVKMSSSKMLVIVSIPSRAWYPGSSYATEASTRA